MASLEQARQHHIIIVLARRAEVSICHRHLPAVSEASLQEFSSVWHSPSGRREAGIAGSIRPWRCRDRRGRASPADGNTVRVIDGEHELHVDHRT